MRNTFKIRTKFFGAFAVILLLLVGLSFVANKGLSGVFKRVEIFEVFNEMDQHINTARIQEKNYMITHDKTATQSVFEELDRISALSERLQKTFAETDISLQARSIEEKTGEYRKAFENYLQLAQKKAQLMDDIRTKSLVSMKMSTAIGETQKKLMNETLAMRKKKIATMLFRLDKVTELYEIALIINSQRKSYTQDFTEGMKAEWRGSNRNLVYKINQLKTHLSPSYQKIAERIVKENTQYVQSVDAYALTRSTDDLRKILTTNKTFTFSIFNLKLDLKHEFEMFQEDINALIEIKLLINENTNTVMQSFIDSRMMEKDLIITADTTLLEKIQKRLETIFTRLDTLKENFKEQAETQSYLSKTTVNASDALSEIGKIEKSIKAYEAAFVDYVQLMTLQTLSEKQMIQAAESAQKVCANAYLNQRALMMEQMARAKTLILYGTLFTILLGTLFALFAVITTIRPLKTAVSMLKDISKGEGDLTRRLITKSNDEIGELAHWFNRFVENVQGLITIMAGNVNSLTRTSNDMLEISNELNSQLNQMSDQSREVSASTKNMTRNIDQATHAMGNASSNVSTVANAAEEMNKAISKIVDNTDSARDITKDAVSQSSQVTKRVGELGKAADGIGKVVETITEISEQVNLLALNATIEAARAGEAGKGFAVVANEIKELASQTSIASGEIKERVVGIQNSTGLTVDNIQKISGAVQSIDDIVGTIARSVEEQAKATEEIALNVTEANQEITDADTLVHQSSLTTKNIADKMLTIDQMVTEISDNSGKVVKTSSADLSSLAEKLSDMVGKFKV